MHSSHKINDVPCQWSRVIRPYTVQLRLNTSVSEILAEPFLKHCSRPGSYRFCLHCYRCVRGRVRNCLGGREENRSARLVCDERRVRSAVCVRVCVYFCAFYSFLARIFHTAHIHHHINCAARVNEKADNWYSARCPGLLCGVCVNAFACV